MSSADTYECAPCQLEFRSPVPDVAYTAWHAHDESVHQRQPNPLSFETLRRTNLLRVNDFFHPRRGLQEWTSLEWAACTAGEVGEMVNKIKKVRRRGRRARPSSEEALEIAKEIGDSMLYLDLTAASLNIHTDAATIIAFNDRSRELGCTVLLPEEAY